MIKNETIDFNGISITTKYGGSGKDAIIFIHGSCMDSDAWFPQFENEKLSNKYQLIAFDLPGNGQSGWYQNDTTGYRPKKMGLLVQAIVEKYSLKKFLLLGLSYGTNIIGEISPPLPGCVGILLESPCIVNEVVTAEKILTPGPNGHVIVAANPTGQELRDYIFLHERNKEIAEGYIKTYRAADPAFREELGKAMFENDLTDELENIKKWNLPVCVAFGKDETLIKTNYLDDFEPLWNKKVYLIEHAGHFINKAAPQAFNELLLSFALDVFK